MKDLEELTPEELSERFDIKKKLGERRLRTARWRPLPGFLVIGGHRCGSTSLYSYLVQHPQITTADVKEVHYFDLNYAQGENWYRAHFPHVGHYIANGIFRRRLITGEATPYYLTHPHCPTRAAKLIPRAKIIVILRNPIDRAYSHYHHQVKKGLETLSFEDALDREEERIAGEFERMMHEPGYYSFPFRKFSYKRRGHYAEQIEAWLRHFPRGRMLVLKTEAMESDGQSVVDRAFQFLGMKPHRIPQFQRHHQSQYEIMPEQAREKLAAYFEPRNRALESLLGERFDWT